MQKVEKAVQDYYADDFSKCYGCGRLNEDGLQLRTGWDGDQTITIYKPRPEHKAVPGFVYGGLIASLIDCHGTGSASLAAFKKSGYHLGDGNEPPRFVTASLSVNYLKPTPEGVPLKAIGTPEEVHPKKWKVHTKVYAGDELVVTGEIVAAVMPKTFMKK